MNHDGRSSGVQLHLTSLPDGRLGPSARAWVDWLQAAGQTYWQVLPLGPPDRYGSPYKASSAFAAWPGFLEDPEAEVSAEEEEAFRAKHAFWIEGWERFAGAGAVADQIRFDREWGALRAYAAERGVLIVGDVPIYVAPDGADQRAWPELFRDGVQAGAPPDAYTADGQLWGNPIYDWPRIQARGYRWWIERLRRTFDLVDVTRVDHFRGFVSYWSVPAEDTTARGGAWKRGPGRAVFDACTEALGPLPVLAEDLGVITPPVRRLREALGFPGMLVLQFGLDPEDTASPHRPERHTRDKWLYVSTHDSDTAAGWWADQPARVQEEVAAQLRSAGLDDDVSEPHWALIRLAFSSVCPTAMLAAQDVLGLGSEARMNVPGTKGEAWKWRLEAGALTDAHAARLREATEAAGRLA